MGSTVLVSNPLASFYKFFLQAGANIKAGEDIGILEYFQSNGTTITLEYRILSIA
jgi:hypothetical protein